MRIAIIAPDATWRGGITHYTQQLTKALEDHGNDLTLISYKKIVPKILYKGEIPKNKDTPKPKYQILKYYSPLSAVHAIQIMKKERINLIHLQWWAPHLFPLTLWLLLLNQLTLKLPAVLTVHNVLPHEHKKIGAFAIKTLSKYSTALIVHTHENKKQLKQLGVAEEKIHIVPMGNFTLFPHQHISKQEARKQLGINAKYVILHFGIIRKYKGLEHLLRAAPEIIQREPDTCILIAGEFWEPLEQYQKLIRQLHIEKHTRIHPHYIPDEEVHKYFTAADVVVCTHTNFQAQSAIPGIARAFNTPIVASTELKEAITPETGITCNPQNTQELTRAILTILHKKIYTKQTNPDETEKWETIAAKTTQIYKK